MYSSDKNDQDCGVRWQEVLILLVKNEPHIYEKPQVIMTICDYLVHELSILPVSQSDRQDVPDYLLELYSLSSSCPACWRVVSSLMKYYKHVIIIG